MQINCPYCGTPYDIDESLLPDAGVRTRCRVCQRVFILNKNTGAVKDDSEPKIEQTSNDKPNNSDKISENHPENNAESNKALSKTDNPASEETGSSDFMQSIMDEINSAVAEETDKRRNNAEAGSGSGSKSPGSTGKRKTTPFQIVMLIVLIVLFLIAVTSVLVHYNIISIPFLPPNVSSFLTSI